MLINVLAGKDELYKETSLQKNDHSTESIKVIGTNGRFDTYLQTIHTIRSGKFSRGMAQLTNQESSF